MFLRLTSVLLLAGALVSGCSGQDGNRKAVTQLIETRSKALNSRNTVLYLSAVSAGYNDKGNDFQHLKENIANNFKSFENISYQPGEHTISIDGNHAEASGTYRMRVVVHGRELVLDGTEHLKFAKEPEGWKIIAGL